MPSSLFSGFVEDRLLHGHVVRACPPPTPHAKLPYVCYPLIARAARAVMALSKLSGDEAGITFDASNFRADTHRPRDNTLLQTWR